MNVKLRPGTPEEAGMSARRIRRVADLAEGWVAQGAVQGIVVLAARKGIIVLHEAFGRHTPAPDAPSLELDAVFPLASLTKPITATAVMILMEDGLLGLNRPVSDYVPGFGSGGKEAVMVHHLLTHTSGLRDGDILFFAEYGHSRGEPAEMPPPDDTQHPRIHEYLVRTQDAPLWKQPGLEMAYATHNYNVLGEIVRRVSGSSIADFAAKRIFEPLGMADTFYAPPRRLYPRIVKHPAHMPYAEGMERSLDVPWGGAGLVSTAMDMAIFGQMFLNRGAYGEARILGPASVAEMTRNQVPGISSWFEGEFFPEASWGLGWGVRGNKKDALRGSLISPQTFYHGGAGHVQVWVDPVYEIVGAYFAVELEPRRRTDLFSNALMAAVVDE
jgi:CubicO group peptidase (beta-lactamase class C family)